MNLLIMFAIFGTCYCTEVFIRVESGDNDINPRIDGDNIIYENWAGDVMMVCELHAPLLEFCTLMSGAENIGIVILSVVCATLIPIPFGLISYLRIKYKNRLRKNYVIIE